MPTTAEILARSVKPPRQLDFSIADPDPEELHPPEPPPPGMDEFGQMTIPSFPMSSRTRDRMALETAASKWRLANVGSDNERKRATEDPSVAYDLAQAATGSPAVAALADLFAPRPPETGLDVAMLGIAGKPRTPKAKGPEFVGPPPAAKPDLSGQFFHGTNQEFEEFAPRPGYPGGAHYFTPRYQSAKNYSGAYPGGDPRVIAAKLDVKNPLVVGPERAEEMASIFPETAARFKEQGYDGVVVLNRDGSVQEIAAFDPGQIRTINPRADDPAESRGRLTDFYNTAAEQANLDPKDRFQPDPSHQVIDTSYETGPPFVGPPQDLSQLYARHPDPTAALPTKDRARFFTDPVRKEAIAQRLVEKIKKSGVMNSDARYFYGSAGPLFRAARKAGLTLNEAMAWIRDFGSFTGATSPRTEVVPNVRNATSVMAKTAAGIPHREILGPGTIDAKTGEKGISEKSYPMMTGESKGGLHGKLIDDVISGRGINPKTNTKPAVFEKQVGQGNLSGVTADTHIVRGAVITANELYPGQIPIDWIKSEHRAAYRANPAKLTPDMVDDSLGSQMVNGEKMQTEFPVIADLYHRAAKILKVDPAEAQAMGWFGMGGETNLGSQLETVAKVLNDRISVTAQALGKTPEWVAEQVFRRKIPVMSILGGTAAGAAGAAGLGAAGQPQEDPNAL